MKDAGKVVTIVSKARSTKGSRWAVPWRRGTVRPRCPSLRALMRCIAADGSRPNTRRRPPSNSHRRAPVPKPTSRTCSPCTKGSAARRQLSHRPRLTTQLTQSVGPRQLVVEEAVKSEVDETHEASTVTIPAAQSTAQANSEVILCSCTIAAISSSRGPLPSKRLAASNILAGA